MSKVQTYPGYVLKNYRWNYAQEVYDGSAFEFENENNAKNYFPKKEQRENTLAYNERLKMIDPAIYYPTGIDSLVGTMFVSDSGDSQTWEKDGKGLGDPSDPDSLAYQFINDCNGNGLNWGFVGKQGSIKLAMKHTIYALVEGIPEDSEGNAIGGPTAHLIDPESVINKIYEKGRMIACRVKEDRNSATTLDDIPEVKTCYVDYTLEGWNRWYYGEGGEKIPFEGASGGEYTYWRTKDQKERILPIFEVSLPLDRPVGYLWAKKCISIANKESELEFAYRNSSFAIFQPVASDTQWQAIKEDLKKGYNAFPSDPEASRGHAFIAPPSDHFDSYRGYIKEKIKNFFYNMFKDYGDAAKEATATQIRLESQSGIEAFLILLAGQTDELENGILWRVEQCHFPDSPENWGIARVERSNDFSPIDLDLVASNLANRYVSGSASVPANAEIIEQVLTKIYEADGLDVPENLTEIAKSFIDKNTQEKGLFDEFGVGN